MGPQNWAAASPWISRAANNIRPWGQNISQASHSGDHPDPCTGAVLGTHTVGHTHSGEPILASLLEAFGIGNITKISLCELQDG